MVNNAKQANLDVVLKVLGTTDGTKGQIIGRLKEEETTTTLRAVRKKYKGSIRANYHFLDKDGSLIAEAVESDYTIEQVQVVNDDKGKGNEIRLQNIEASAALEVKKMDSFKLDLDLKTKEEKLTLLKSDVNQNLKNTIAVADASKTIFDPLRLINKPGSDDVCKDKGGNILTHWQALISRNALRHGIDMDRDPPMPAFKQALEFSDQNIDYLVHDASEIDVTATDNHVTQSRASAGFVKASANVSVPYCNVQTSMEYKKKGYKDTETKTVLTVARSLYPRIRVQLRLGDVEASKDFLKDVMNAVGYVYDEATSNEQAIKKDPMITIEEKFIRLREVFKLYGHVWATEVTLGGCLYTTDSLQVEKDRTEDELEWGLSVAATVKTAPVKVEAESSYSKGEKKINAEVKGLAEKCWKATGGNPLLATNPTLYPASVADPELWRVIKREGVRPLYDLLPDELRKEVINVHHGYCPPSPASIFVRPQPVDLDTNFEATSDCFVLATIQGKDRSDTGVIQCTHKLGIEDIPPGKSRRSSEDTSSEEGRCLIETSIGDVVLAGTVLLPIAQKHHYEVMHRSNRSAAYKAKDPTVLLFNFDSGGKPERRLFKDIQLSKESRLLENQDEVNNWKKDSVYNYYWTRDDTRSEWEESLPSSDEDRILSVSIQAIVSSQVIEQVSPSRLTAGTLTLNIISDSDDMEVTLHESVRSGNRMYSCKNGRNKIYGDYAASGALTVPVRKKSRVKMTFKNHPSANEKDPKFKFNVSQIALNGTYFQFDSPEARNKRTVYTATSSPGLLIGDVTGDIGGKGISEDDQCLKVRIGNEEGMEDRAKVHRLDGKWVAAKGYKEAHGVMVPYRSFSVPVLLGESYEILVREPGNVSCWWVPIRHVLPESAANAS